MANIRRRGPASDIENPQEKAAGPGTTNRKDYWSTTRVMEVICSEDPIWRKIFVTSCVLAVPLDPLFFYLLIVDQENKCLEMDKKLMYVSLFFRALTDTILLLHFICSAVQIKMVKRLSTNVATTNTVAVVAPIATAVKKGVGGGGSGGNSTPVGRLFIQAVREIARKMSWSSSLIIDFLALLPVPQLLIVVTFYKMRGSGLERLKIFKFLLLAQYIPRIHRIRLSSREFRKTARLWVAVLFNISFYILFSHVLGAYWYFFSIERETSCWYSACVKYSTDPTRCMNSFHCDSKTITSRHITFLNEHCPLDTPDSALQPFNFGIFLDSLKNNTEMTGFGKKFFYSFWWGLRNISNFGTNLTTSTYVWENLFAILISIASFILISFLFEMGKNHMALEKEKMNKIKSEEEKRMKKRKLEEEKRIKQKKLEEEKRMKKRKLEDEKRIKKRKLEEEKRIIRLKRLEAGTWISRNEIPDDLREEIMENIKQIVKGHKDADLQSDIFSILPQKTRRSLKRCLCFRIIKTVPTLEKMNIRVLEMMCDHMKLMMYDENSFPFRIGDPLDRMLFILEGTMWTYSCTSDQSQSVSTSASTRMTAKSLGKGQFFGEELLDWASPNLTDLPVSRQHVKSQTKVKAFALMAEDLSYIVSRFPVHWYICHDSEKMEEVAASAIERAFRHWFNNRATTTHALTSTPSTTPLPAAVVEDMEATSTHENQKTTLTSYSSTGSSFNSTLSSLFNSNLAS